jgi:hypothetical protein
MANLCRPHEPLHLIDNPTRGLAARLVDIKKAEHGLVDHFGRRKFGYNKTRRPHSTSAE